MEGVLFYSNSFTKVKRILARLIQGWSLRAAGLKITADALGEPTDPELEQAEILLLLLSVVY